MFNSRMECPIGFVRFSWLSRNKTIECAWCDNRTGSIRKHICQTFSGNMTDPFFILEQTSFALILFSQKNKSDIHGRFLWVKSRKIIAQHFSKILKGTKVLNPIGLFIVFWLTKSTYFFFTANTLLRHNLTFLLCVYYRSTYVCISQRKTFLIFRLIFH